MRVLLDTNVLLSAAFTPGLCSRLLIALVGGRRWQIIFSDPLLAEFRRHGVGRFKAPPERVEAFLMPLLEWGVLVRPVAVSSDVCRDPNDLAILGTAMAGKAEVLVTGDNDLLILGHFSGIPIVSPREFHDRFVAG